MREGSERSSARGLRVRRCEAPAPAILLSELRNVLVGSVRGGLLDADDALGMLDDAGRILADRVAAVDGAAVFRSALDLGLSAYDAEFVVLARALGAPLVTEDHQILEAAPGVAVPLA
ncbi:MAG: type II toxin-antitoxin system VapC family toxin [Gemmatimonadales bacterium]|nr:type II toxin-antitoxin system VapC family toxin [Gemmatimonadales bacterium]